MKDLYMVVWSGGYEAPQYQVLDTDIAAWALAQSWADDMDDESDWIDVLRINGSDLSVERLGEFLER